MKRITAIAALVGLLVLGSVDARADVANDFMCGLYRVTIGDDAHLRVNGEDQGEHRTTMLDDQSNYVHQFGDRAELRVTQHGRVAFRIPGETRWNGCKPLVLYAEATR